MSDGNPSSADLLGAIADEFVEAFRQGKCPSVEEFAARYPEHAAEIRDILPALVLREKAKASEAPGPQDPARAPSDAAPVQQLGDHQVLREIGRGLGGVTADDGEAGRVVHLGGPAPATTSTGTGSHGGAQLSTAEDQTRYFLTPSQSPAPSAGSTITRCSP